MTLSKEQKKDDYMWHDSAGREDVQFAVLRLISNFLWLFLVFEIRKNLDLRKILVTSKIFFKSRVHCTT